jgi:hypothetical protein
MAKNNSNDPPGDELPDDFFDDDGEDNGGEDGDGNDFWEGMELSEQSEEEMRAERKERHDRIYGHRVYKQAEEVYRVTEALVASMQSKEEGKVKDESIAALLMEAALMIQPKIAGAIGSQDYFCAMQNAAIIRDRAEYLRLVTNTLHHLTKVDRSHCKIHRQEMEKFRVVFCEWMDEVKKYDKIGDDEWNVF